MWKNGPGILGTGKTGRIVGEILRGFRMRVLASDPFPNQEWAAQNEIEYVETNTLAKKATSLPCMPL